MNNLQKYFVLFIAVVPLFGTTLHVSPTGSDPEGDGSLTSPYATIQYGLTQTENGDTVLVHEGEYITSSDIVVNAEITLTLLPDVVVRFDDLKKIDVFGTLIGEGMSTTPIIFTSNQTTPNPGDWQSINFINSDSSILTHCLIQYASFNEDGYMYYGAISCDNSSPQIEYCIIEQNERWGVVCHNNSNPTIQFCDIRYNGWDGIKIHNQSSPHVINNKIYSNGTFETSTYCGIIFNSAGNPVIRKNLIYYHYGAGISAIAGTTSNKIIGNTIVHNGIGIHLNEAEVHVKNGVIWMNQSSIVSEGSDSIEVMYSSIQDGWEGVGNIDEYPHFIDPDNQNYQLHAYSPCVDAGDPDLDNDGESWEIDIDDQDPDGTRLDMGTFFTEYQDSTGSISGTIEVPTGYSGYLWYGIWFPGMDLNNDEPHIGKDSIEVINGGFFDFLFERLPEGSGFVVQSIIDQTGSPIWGPDGCDQGFDLIGGSDSTDVFVGQNTQTNFTLVPCDEYIIDDYSISLNGLDAFARVEHIDHLNPENITVAAWIYPRSWSGNNRIIHKGTIDSQFFIEGAGDQLEWVINDNAFVVQAPLPSIETWTHVAGTYDGSYAKLYIDHELISYVELNEQFSTTSDPVIIGAKIDIDQEVDFFDGLIHDVAIWNRSLNETELYTAMNDPSQVDSLIGYWPLDHGFGLIAYDLSGNDQHGYIHYGWWEDITPDAPILPANLGIELFSFPSVVEPGQILNTDLQLQLVNNGMTVADSFYVGVYLSEDSTIIPSLDIQLTGGYERIYDLQNNDTITVQFYHSVSIPENTEYGNWFIGPYADVLDEIPESEEGDNWLSSLISITGSNQPPVVSFIPMPNEVHDLVAGEVAYYDNEGDSLTFELFYSVDDIEWFTPTIDTTDLITDSTFGFIWNSIQDIGSVFQPQLTLKAVVSDGLNEVTVVTNPFEVDNFVGEIQLDETFYPAEVSGDIRIPYEIIDPTEDLFSIDVQYSLDDGNSWSPATIMSETNNIGVDSYSDTLLWSSNEDIPNTDTTLLLSAIASDNWEQGVGDTIVIHVDNETLPFVTSIDLQNLRWNNEIIIQFSEELDPETIASGITITSAKYEYEQIFIDYQSQLSTVTIFEDSGWAGGDTLTLNISTALTNSWGNPFDGNENGDPDGVGDHRTWVWSVDYLGDFNRDTIIDFEDLVQLQQIWWADELVAYNDIGPSNGTPPYLQPAADGLFDFEDLMVFVQMWNWQHSSGFIGKIMNRVRPKISDETERIWISTDHAERIIDDQTDLFTIRLNVDSLTQAIGSLEFTLSYPSEQLVMVTYETTTSDDWVTLVYHDDGNSTLSFNLADLDQSTQSINANPISVTLRKKDEETALLEWCFDGRNYSGESIIYIEKTSMMDMKNPIPDQFALYPNYPNPFNPITTIRYDIPEDIHFDLSVYNLMGQRITTLVKGKETAGSKSIVWNGKDHIGKEVSSGMYFIVFRSSAYNATQKVILLR